MKIIVGLGNPTAQYAGTRHNMGFAVIEELAEQYNIKITEKKHKALLGTGRISGEKAILAMPQTYMNLSGESVREIIDYYKIDSQEDLIVVYDDISLDVGKLRIRPKGSAGGHNGIKSIISHLGEDIFIRVKVGVGEKRPGQDLADHVLGRFTKEEQPMVREAAKKACDAIECILSNDVNRAMNDYN